MPHAQDAALTRHRTPTPHPLLTSTPSFLALSPHLFVMQMDSKEGAGFLRETFGVTIQEDGSVLIPRYGQSRLSELGRALFNFIAWGVELGLQLIGSTSGMVFAVMLFQLVVGYGWYLSTFHLRNPIGVDKPTWYGMTWTSRPN